MKRPLLTDKQRTVKYRLWNPGLVSLQQEAPIAETLTLELPMSPSPIHGAIIVFQQQLSMLPLLTSFSPNVLLMLILAVATMLPITMYLFLKAQAPHSTALLTAQPAPFTIYSFKM